MKVAWLDRAVSQPLSRVCFSSWFPVVAAGASASLYSGTRPTWTVPGSQGDSGNAEYIWGPLIDDGLTPEAAAGGVGQSAPGDWRNVRLQDRAGGGRVGDRAVVGGERWDGPDGLVPWAQRTGRDEWSLQTQVTWLLKEMHQGWGRSRWPTSGP